MPELTRLAPWLGLAGAVGLLLGIVAMVVAALSISASRRLKERMDRILRHSQATDIEELLHQQWQSLRAAQDGVEAASVRLDRAEAALGRAIQNVGIIRYNAFPGAGAELSFSIALLDPARDGVVISGLYGREETRIYAKPVAGGASRYPLSDEEREAIRTALEVHAV
ncbi:MAG: DUF4446 family protein [Thermaerobacter sp.]|nr:DUF4446 family protein [Thermaerobacter sp.]